MNILGIAGSLRKDSYNRKLLAHADATAVRLGGSVRIHDLIGIPLYNQDVEDEGLPEAVAKFRADLNWADAVIVCTPEYNNSIPGVLKNAIDWGSRPPNQWGGKVAAIMGATVGGFGTALAHAHLRQILLILNVVVVPYPFVYISKAQEALDANGAPKDERTRENMEAILKRLIAVTQALKQQP
jgi:chromate reductase, NAD(P)H dehydrogenase (quinone)